MSEVYAGPVSSSPGETPGERRDFLDAIIAEPADDTRRLIYADWLEENGEAERAEFIRVQCDLRRTEIEHKMWSPRWENECKGAGCSQCQKWRSIKNRETDLITSLNVVVMGWHNGKDVVQYEYRRGFIGKLTGPLTALLEHGPKICREHPVEAVEVTDQTPLVEVILGSMVDGFVSGSATPIYASEFRGADTRTGSTLSTPLQHVGTSTGRHFWGGETTRHINPPIGRLGLSSQYSSGKDALADLNRAVLDMIRWSSDQTPTLRGSAGTSLAAHR